MGKPLIIQKRGKGADALRAPSFTFKAKAAHPPVQAGELVGVVAHITTCRAHSAPIAFIEYTQGTSSAMVAPEGLVLGQSIFVGGDCQPDNGNTLELVDIPEGTLIYNIEARPGDGGKFVRASGGYARVESKTPNGVIVRLPSRTTKTLHPKCRATVGIVAGGGRTEKPMLKAGAMHYKKKARGHLYPVVSGSAMNAVDHPYGNKRTLRKSKAKPTSRHAAAGRKVGMIAASRTGRKKR